MSDALLILPESTRNNALPLLWQGIVGKLCPGYHEEVFYQSGENSLELKKLLLSRYFDTIIIGFPTLSTEIPQVQMVKSISTKSKLVLIHPELNFVKSTMKNHGGDCDLFRWHEMGKLIQLNICRHADLVVAASENDQKLLQASLPVVTVLNGEKLGEGGATIEKRKYKKVSIIVLTFNQLADIRRCIESLEKYTTLEYELIVIDNGSNDGTWEYLTKLQENKNIRLIFNDSNVGFSRANNQGISVATGQYILLLNNDVVLTSEWLERMLICAESDPSIGVVGPLTNHAVGQQLVTIDLPLENAEIQKYACSNMLKNAGYWFETHRIIGFCMLVKREVIERIGMLDERFGPGGFEDFDFCLRVKQGGYRIMIASDVFVYHIGGKGYAENNLDYSELRQKNVRIFIEKWCERSLEIMEKMPDGH